jgi:PAS domain S-box-containing protein
MKVKFRLTIARKLTLGFGLLLIAVISTSYFNYNTLDRIMKEKLNAIMQLFLPSTNHLNEMYNGISNSKTLIKTWVWVDKKDDTPDKKRLKEIHTKTIPEIKEALAPMIPKWEKADQDLYNEVVMSIDTLFQLHKSIMGMLNSFDSYSDILITFSVQPQVDENGEVIVLTDKILLKLNTLTEKMRNTTEQMNTEMKDSFQALQQLILWLALSLVFSVILIGVITTRALVAPTNYLKNIILQMGKGILPKERIKEGQDEIGEMSGALNILVSSLKRISEFALKIGEGNFQSQFEPQSKQDVLGNSLILMRNNLKEASEAEEKRKKEDSHRSWAAQGLAKFSEILRQNNDNMQEFSFAIISNLVKYLGITTGGFYIINDESIEDTYIELTACVAYNRKKYLQKRIEIGVTLVGQCVQERETIYLTDIPGDYIKITSGLGVDNPKSLLLIPLKVNEDVFGVVELASFEPFEQYQIEFIEKLSESIASTISSVKISVNTAKLLAESREKSERLAQQEEEVRQNIEEMMATQDEMVHQIKEEKKRNSALKQEFNEKITKLEQKLKSQQELQVRMKVSLDNNIEAVNNSFGVVEYKMHGEFLNANDKFLRMTGMSFAQFTGKLQSMFMMKEKVNAIEFQTLWSDLSKGKTRSLINQYFFDDKERWFYETFSPVKNEKGEFFKVITLVQDITELAGILSKYATLQSN